MALKTLEEINQEFLFERLAGGGHKTVLVTYRSKTSKLNKNLIRPRSGHHNLPFATCHLPFGLRSRPLEL